MVPVATELLKPAFTGCESVTVNVSSSSSSVSPMIGTLMSPFITPGANVRVPEVAT